MKAFGLHNMDTSISEVIYLEIYRGHTFYIVRHNLLGNSHLCGYVAMTEQDHGWKLSEEESDFGWIDCHGGITFAEVSVSNQIIGFDCAHGCDLHNPKSLEFVINECQYIVDQIINPKTA